MQQPSGDRHKVAQRSSNHSTEAVKLLSLNQASGRIPGQSHNIQGAIQNPLSTMVSFYFLSALLGDARAFRLLIVGSVLPCDIRSMTIRNTSGAVMASTIDLTLNAPFNCIPSSPAPSTLALPWTVNICDEGTSTGKNSELQTAGALPGGFALTKQKSEPAEPKFLRESTSEGGTVPNAG